MVRKMRSRSRKIRIALAAAVSLSLLVTAVGFLEHSREAPLDESPAVVERQDSGLSLFDVPPSTGIRVATRPVYPYSIIPGGIGSRQELVNRIEHDTVVAKHYAGFEVSRARLIRAAQNRLVYVSYRMDEQVFWTKKKLRVPKGETLLSDGTHYARARCGNRISEVPMTPTSVREPEITSLDPPSLPDPPPVIFPVTPSAQEPPVTAFFPPSTGESSAPPIIPVAPIPFGPSGGGGNPGPGGPQANVPPGPQFQPVSPVPEPPTIWLTTIGAACALFRQIWHNRHKHLG
jgi:hypothetical protein